VLTLFFGPSTRFPLRASGVGLRLHMLRLPCRFGPMPFLVGLPCRLGRSIGVCRVRRRRMTDREKTAVRRSRGAAAMGGMGGVINATSAHRRIAAGMQRDASPYGSSASPIHPLEIVAAILFLNGAASSFITGAALAVDGGRTFH
jgi:hypothetical protein